MQTEHIIALLIEERDKLNRAIEVLQGPTKRRGRPPKNSPTAAAIAVSAPAAAKRKRRIFSNAQRKLQAERMKAYWAAKRKAHQPKAASKTKKAARAA